MTWKLDFEGIEVDAHHPTAAWKRISQKIPCTKISVQDLPQKGLRIVCISDTHFQHEKLALPEGDILIHAGDFSRKGGIAQIKDFLDWFDRQPHRYKVLVAGNHDTILHREYYLRNWRRFFRLLHTQEELEELYHHISSLSSVCYLQDQSVHIGGLHIYGSPWQPTFFNWAFNLDRGEACAQAWKQIPENIDILITHGPPLGYGDLCSTYTRAGCVDLLHHIRYRIRPKVHIFGHIHEAAGCYRDESRLFINASSCDLRYRPRNPVIAFGIEPSKV